MSAIPTNPAPPVATVPPRPFSQSTLAFVLRRAAKAIITIWLAVSLTFFLIRLMPGNPIDIFMEDLVRAGASAEDARNQAAMMMNLPLDQPVTTQYVNFIGNLLKGDLGTSYKARGVPVGEIIAQRLPWTIFSVGTSLLVSFTLGIILGTLAAFRRNTLIDYLISNFAAVMEALPQFTLALLFVLMLGAVWKVIPISQMRGALSPGIEIGFTAEFFGDVLSHLRVPLAVYVLTSVGGWILAMRANTFNALGEDYVTVAKARGLKDSRIMMAYVGRNASLPLFTRLAIVIGFSMGGSLIIESIFKYRGLGWEAVLALGARDYPVMQGIFLVTTAAVVISGVIADFLYGYLDPRVRIATTNG
jgi:peptide/nickel transport system permease protein